MRHRQANRAPGREGSMAASLFKEAQVSLHQFDVHDSSKRHLHVSLGTSYFTHPPAARFSIAGKRHGELTALFVLPDESEQLLAVAAPVKADNRLRPVAMLAHLRDYPAVIRAPASDHPPPSVDAEYLFH